jgi:hypothetical protein
VGREEAVRGAAKREDTRKAIKAFAEWCVTPREPTMRMKLRFFARLKDVKEEERLKYTVMEEDYHFVDRDSKGNFVRRVLPGKTPKYGDHLQSNRQRFSNLSVVGRGKRRPEG